MKLMLIIILAIPGVIGIVMFFASIFCGDEIKKRRNIMTSTAIATFKKESATVIAPNDPLYYSLEYEFYAPEDCCYHILSTEKFIPFLKVSKRQKKPIMVCYDPHHPAINAIMNENGKIIRRPYQAVFIIVALFLIAFSILCCVAIGGNLTIPK